MKRVLLTILAVLLDNRDILLYGRDDDDSGGDDNSPPTGAVPV